MVNRGKLVIVSMLVLALAAAAFSVWYHYVGSHRASDFYGTPTALLFVRAPEIVALRLEAMDQPEAEIEGMEPEPPDGPTIEFANQYWKIGGEAEVAKARGMANIRQALVQDACYDWRAPRPKELPDWQYALQFNDGRLWATVLFDFDSRQVALAGGKRSATLDAAVSADWKRFFAEQTFEEPAEMPAEIDERPERQPVAGSAEEAAATSDGVTTAPSVQRESPEAK